MTSPMGDMAEDKTYFITYDIDYLANLGETQIGLNINNTSYFQVNAPKQVQTVSFYSTIDRVTKYPDTVTVNPQQSTLGPGLMQGATNQCVFTFTAQTAKSDAYFQTLTVNRTGTAQDSDVTAVKLWFDGNNNSILDLGTTNDYVIGQGYFGNVGNAGQALITVSTNAIVLSTSPYTAAVSTVTPNVFSDLITAARGTMRFFITYDINSTALPQNTLGASLASNCMTVATPNTLGTVNNPTVSTLRTITASPRQVTVVPQALNVAPLAQSLGTADTSIFISSPVANFPTSGGLVIDSEIILYTSVNTGNNSFTGLTRGAWNTLVVPHSAGTQVAPSYQQGTLNAPMLKLTLSCNGYQVPWYAVDFSRLVPAGLSGKDTDITAIKVWRDNGSGVLNRDPITGLIGAETLISTGSCVFGNTYAGQSRVRLAGDGVDGSGNTYVLISATPTVYWVTMDVNQTSSKGSVISIGCNTSDNVEVNPPEET